MKHEITCFSDLNDDLLWQWELTDELYAALDTLLARDDEDPQRVLCYLVTPDNLATITGIPSQVWLRDCSYFLEPVAE